ncbi:MAG: HD domain-containing protein [Bacilli bacterium]|nr:HD domain-containing protein [Bacilli bacterium]
MEKFRKQLYEILMQDDVVSSIRNNLDQLIKIIPEIKYMINFPHNHPHHHLDVFEHTLLALGFSNYEFDERLCLLLHDIGKPFSYQDEEVRHFRGHPEVSAIMSFVILTRLNYPPEFVEKIIYLIRYHDTPIKVEDIESNYDLAYKRFLIQISDAYAHNPLKLEKRIAYLKNMKNKFENYKVIKK